MSSALSYDWYPGNGSLVTHEKIVWSAASSTSATRIAGNGYFGMNSGTVKRSRTTTKKTVSAPIGRQRNPTTSSRSTTTDRRYGAVVGESSCAARGGAL